MGDNDAETFANITRADFDFDDEAFDSISNEAKGFISELLVKRKELIFCYYLYNFSFLFLSLDSNMVYFVNIVYSNSYNCFS